MPGGVVIMSERKNHKDSPMTVTSEDLVKRSDLTAEQSLNYEKLFHEHWSRVFEVLYRLVGEKDEAEDLALEAFWRLYNRTPKYDSSEKLSGWLYRVAMNLGFNALRARKRRQRYEEEAGYSALDTQATPDPQTEIERLEEAQLVRKILSQMKPRHAKLLILRNSGFSYAELASILAVSPGSIGTMLVRSEAEFKKRYTKVK